MSKIVGFHLSEELVERLKEHAAKQERTLSGEIRLAIRRYLEKISSKKEDQEERHEKKGGGKC